MENNPHEWEMTPEQLEKFNKELGELALPENIILGEN